VAPLVFEVQPSRVCIHDHDLLEEAVERHELTTQAEPLMSTASFVTYLQRPRELPAPEFRAPPPSPVTGVLTGSSSSGSSGYGECQDDDDIGRFLRCSARVPVLRLPEGPRPGPRRNKNKTVAAWAPPVVDMRLLDPVPSGDGGSAVEAMRAAAVAFGCFQMVGHGVHASLLSAASRAAKSRRSPALETEGMRAGDEDELWWLRGEGDQEMAGTQPLRNGPDQFRYGLPMSVEKLR
jgi:hypothetical protein